MRKGANPSLTDNCGISLLTYATIVSRPNILKALIEAGADVNFADHYSNEFPLLNALEDSTSDTRYTIIKLLIKAGARVDVRYNSGQTALMKAVSNADPEVVELLISAGANVDLENDGKTAYAFAAVSGSEKLKAILLQAGADPGIGIAKYVRDWGENAFFQAAADGRPDVVEAMLARGLARVDMVNASKATALMRTQDAQTVDILLKAGANVNLRNDRGYTALIWASAYGEVEIVKKLIAAGADVNATTNDGESALDFVGEDGEIGKLLQQAGARKGPRS
jgi:ankyrin repeat protein